MGKDHQTENIVLIGNDHHTSFYKITSQWTETMCTAPVNVMVEIRPRNPSVVDTVQPASVLEMVVSPGMALRLGDRSAVESLGRNSWLQETSAFINIIIADARTQILSPLVFFCRNLTINKN